MECPSGHQSVVASTIREKRHRRNRIMADEYPTKTGGLTEYEPPTLNNPNPGPASGGPSTSGGVAFSTVAAQGEGRDAEEASGGAAALSVQEKSRDESREPDSNQRPPNSPHAMSVHPVHDENQVVVARSLPRKSLAEAYILGIVLGFMGAHHFYLRRGGFGALYLFTFGLFGVGWFVDLARMPCLVEEANRKILDPKYTDKKNVSDAYVLWFPFGIVGFHHYFLENWLWGVIYTFSFGLIGVGWIIDAFRIPTMVSQYNTEMQRRRETNTLPVKKLGDAYILGATPLGLLGAHHYYLGRYLFGVAYTLTLGLFGIGWLVDICRMPVLVERANKAIREGDERLKYVDDAYVLCFPLGFLGLHHFYLHRYCWGFLYVFTFGLFGIGWIIDWCRIPWLVADVNEKIREENLVVEHLRSRMGPNAQIVVTETSVVVTNPGGAAQGGSGGVGTVCDSAAVPRAEPTSSQHNIIVMPAAADTNSQGQILQPPSYESVFGGSQAYTSQTLHSAGAVGPSTDNLTGVENAAFCDNKKAAPTKDIP